MLRPLLSATLFAIALTNPALAQRDLEDAKLLATACNRFAADLRGKLASDGNQALSPASIAIALMKSAKARPDDPAHFVADRPFALALRDNQTGLVLFSARVHDPRPPQTEDATPRSR